MKKIVNIISLFCCLLLLIACPASTLHSYDFVGNNSNEIINGDNSNLMVQNNIGKIACGFLHIFIGEKERRLIASIELLNKDENLITTISSSKFGNLILLELPPKGNLVNLNYDRKVVYVLDFETKNDNKILKMIKDDTITIEFKNGLKYYYVNKQ